MTQEPMQTLPLLFSFKERVMGNGFLAEVRMDGRALLEVEDNGCGLETWVTGVEPVGIAAGGADRNAALRGFHRAWLTALFDLAREASDFAEFERSTQEFLASKVAVISALWDDAVQSVREKKISDPGLKRESASRESTFSIDNLRLEARRNELADSPTEGDCSKGGISSMPYAMVA